MQSEVMLGDSVQDAMRPVMPESIANIVSSAAAHGDGRVHDAFTWLRANHPLSLAETKDFYPFWVVTKHANLRSFAMHPELFLSGASNITLLEREGHRTMREMLDGRPQPMRVIIQMDPPDHRLYRAVVAEKFLPREIGKLTESIRPIAHEFVERMAASGGECDFAQTVSYVYPLRVIMSLLGVPASDELKLLKLAKELQGTHDPDESRAGVAQTGKAVAEETISIVQDIFAYFAELNADRLKNPREDIATLLSQAKIDGKPMPTLELLSYYLVLATAGHDTTSAASGGGMIELARNPTEFAKVQANPALVETFVEETVRWVSPAKMTMREAAQDVEMCGRQIKKGDHIGMAWASGSRDEEVFDDPFTFKVDRRPNRLMGFGFGPHICVGQHLARLEMRLLFEELFKRLESVELNGPTRSIASFQVSGPKSIPIRFKMKY
jgi:cytochrome P450